MEQKQMEQFLSDFRAAVLADAKKERDDRQSALTQRRKQKQQAAKEQALAACLEAVQKENAIEQARVNRALSDKKFEAKKKMLRRRMEIQQEVFSEVERRISAFTASEEYIGRLKKQVKSTDFDMLSDKITVLLPAADRGERALLEQYLPHAKFETDASIRYGGCKVEDCKKHIVLDYTIDSNIHQAFEKFLEISGLAAEIR